MGAKKMQLSNFDVQIAQAVCSVMYTYRPWTWSLINAPLNAVPLVQGIQDYPAPCDMWDLTQAWITVTYPQPSGAPYDPFNPTNGGSPDQDYNLECVKTLTPDKNTTGYYARGACSFIRNYKILRLSNAVQPPSSAPAFLNCQYQPMMEKVTDLSMRLPFPDEFFPVSVAGCLYWLYKFGDDERAGTVIKQGNSIEYTGQLAEFHSMLQVAAAQDLPSEVNTFFPSSPIGSTWPVGPYPYVFIN
jgi:hypothetical protein